DSRVLGAVFNGWSLDGVLQSRTGFPINVVYSNLKIPGAVAATPVRPDLLSGVPIWLYGPQYPGGRALNAKAFDTVTPQAQLRQGTLGRNAISGFGATQLDVSLMRKFRLTERLALQCRIDAFNLFNHPIFFNPPPNLSVPASFGLSAQTVNSGL